MKKIILILIIAITCLSIGFSERFYHFPSKNFDVYYQQSLHESAVQLVQEGNAIYEELSNFYDISLKKRLKVYLLDTVDFANAYADIFSNCIFIYVNRNSTDYYDNSFKWWVPFVFSHELTHMLVANKSDWTKDLLGVFGHPVSILFDTAFTSSFFHEGVSIYSESLLFTQGRLNDKRYLSYLAAEIQDNGFKGLTLAGGMNSPSFTPTGFNYLYGAFFVEYVETVYGVQALKDMVKNYGSSYRFNFITMVEKISGKKFGSFLAEWKLWLQEKTTLKQDSQIHEENLTNSGYYTGINATSKRYLYYFAQKDGEQSSLVRTNDEETSQRSLPFPTDFAVSDNDNLAIIYANSNGPEDYRLNLYIGSFLGPLRKLKGIERPAQVEWFDDETLVFTFLEKGGSGLASYNVKTEKILYHLSPSPDFYINDLSCRDGRCMLSISFGSSADIYEFILEDNRLITLTQTDENEIDVSLCEKGILYSSDRDGKYDIFLMDEIILTKTKLSDSRFGAFKPVTFNNTFYYRGYSGTGFDLYEVLTVPGKEEPFEAVLNTHADLKLDEDLAIENVLRDWNSKKSPLPLPRFGIPALFIMDQKLIGIAGIAGWDDTKEWIWYGYLGGLGDYLKWDYSIIHRGFPDFQITWNGDSKYEELKASVHFPLSLREDERAAYIDPALNLGMHHSANDLELKPIIDFYLYEAFSPIVYPDNPVSVPGFFQLIQIGTSGLFSQTGIGLPLPLSMTGMLTQMSAYSKTSLKAEAWYPLNFISPIGTPEGKFRLSSPILHFGAMAELSEKSPFSGIIGVWFDVGIQYWLDFRLNVDFYIGEQIRPKIGIQNTLLGMI